MGWNRRGFGLAGLCALLVASTISQETHAQSAAELATRRELLTQAQAARRRGDHTTAVDLAQRAANIQANITVLRFLAEEHQALGHLAQSLGAADQCVVTARRENNRRNRPHQQACERIVRDLQPRVGRVIVRVPTPPPPGLHVRVAGEELNSALFGVPHVVTPGEVTVEANAPEFQAFRTQVRVNAQGTSEVEVRMQANAPTAPVAPRVASVRVILTTQGGVPLPSDLRVTLDGEALQGSPPSSSSVTPGEHVLQVSGQGFAPHQQTVALEAGQFRAISVMLVPANALGTIHLVTPVAGAQVLLDGAVVGNAPFHRSDIATGRHIIEVRAPGHAPYQQTIELSPGQTLTLNIDNLQAIQGNVVDPNANVPRTRRVHSPIGPVFMTIGLLGAGGGAFAYLWDSFVYGPSVINRCGMTLAACTQSERNEFQSTREALRLGGIIGMAAGGAIFITGLVLYFTVTYEETIAPQQQTMVRVRPTLDPFSGTAGLQVSF